MQTNSRTEKPTRNASARAMLLVLGLPSLAVAHHEEQGRTQAADDGHERQEHKVFHEVDYPRDSASAQMPLLALPRLAAARWSFAATLALGAWQLGRAAQKLALQAAMQQRRAMPPHRPADAPGGREAAADLLHRPVVLRGTWLPQHTVFLDNRQMDGKPGFYVVTPLQLEGSDGSRAGAARLGPAQLRRSATQLPPIETPAGRGRAARPHRPAARQAIRVRRQPAAAPSGKISTWPSSGPKPVWRCWTCAVQQTGGPSEGLLREWPRPPAACESTTAMPSSGSP